MLYAGNRKLAIHFVACILTETRSFIALIRPINGHQATCFSRALNETRARLANKEEHENKKTLSMNLVEQKEVADKAFFRYPEKKGTALGFKYQLRIGSGSEARFSETSHLSCLQ